MRSKKNGLRYRTVLLAVPAVLSFFFIIIISLNMYYSMAQYLNSSFDNAGKRSLLESAQTINDVLIKTDTVAKLVAEETEITDILRFYHLAPSSQQEINVRLTQYFKELQSINPFVSAMVLLNEYGAVTIGDISLPYDAGQSDMFFDAFGTLQNGYSFSIPGDAVMLVNENELITELNKRFFVMRTIGSQAYPWGYVCVVLSEDFLTEILSEDENVVVSDKTGTMLYYNNSGVSNNTFTALLSNETSDNNILINQNPYFEDLTVFYIKNISEFSDSIRKIQLTNFLFAFLAFLPMAFVAGRFSKTIVSPLQKLTAEITTFEPKKNYDWHNNFKVKGKSFSIRQYISNYLLLVVLGTCLIFGAILAYSYSNIVSDNVKITMKDAFDSAAKRSDEFFTNIEDEVRAISSDPEILESLSTSEHISNDLEGLLPYEFAKFDYDASIAIYDRYSLMICTTDQSLKQLSAPTVKDETEVWDFSESSRIGQNIIFDRMVAGDEKSPRYGWVRLCIDETFLEICYSDLYADVSEVFIYDKDGMIVSHQDKTLIGTYIDLENVLTKDEDSFVYTDTLGSSEFTLIAYFSNSLIMDFMKSLFINSIFLFTTIVLALPLIAGLLSSHLSKHFIRFAYRIANSDLIAGKLLPAEQSYVREINELNQSFQKMALHVQTLISDMVNATQKQHELEINQKRTEYALLQAQINPHFVYNTFESINFMILGNKKEPAISMLNALSHMLRFAARTNEMIIPLREELYYVRTYLKIMEMRYHDALSVTIHSAAGAEDMMVPKFILQPIIENSIYHGCGKNKISCIIDINCKVMDDSLHITIEDNGVGIPYDVLEKLMDDISENKYCNNIGLRNIHNRIVLLFGAPYGLSIRSEKGAGTTVEIILPLMR